MTAARLLAGSRARQASRLKPDKADRYPADAGLPDDADLGIAPPRPALKRFAIGVRDRPHHRTHVEWLLPLTVQLWRENIPDPLEFRAIDFPVRRGAHITVVWVSGRRPAWMPLAGDDIGIVVMAQQQCACVGQGWRPVLSLTVRAHDPLEAADANVVLCGYSAGKVECALARQHHSAGRCHDQNPPRVHEHGGLSVPVRLCANIDPGDDDVDLAADLGEVDKVSQHGGDPVHVLGATVPRDAGTGREREPFHRDLHGARQIYRAHDAPASSQ